MKVFISWSGPQSRDIASAFYNFLRDVIQHIKPFMSKHDIAAGTRWPERLARELATTGFGVICLTPKNQDAAWLMFEAGALSKALDQSLVFPYLYGLKPTDLKWPLAQFQASVVNEEGTKEIILSLNTAMGEHALPADVLERSFNRCWPDYEKALAAISEPEEAPKRDPAEVLEEILAAVRGPKQVATPNDMGMSEYEATHDFDCEFMGGPMERIKERADPSRLAAMATTFYHVTRLEPQTALTVKSKDRSLEIVATEANAYGYVKDLMLKGGRAFIARYILTAVKTTGYGPSGKRLVTMIFRHVGLAGRRATLSR